MEVRTSIIPSKQVFVGEPKTIDYKAICVFAATGFFLDQDTYYNEQKVLKPASDYLIDTDQNQVISQKSYFKWHYLPKFRPFETIVDEFASLFEEIIENQVKGKNVILPLSGGLDSRTQAVALNHLGIKTQSYGYTFDGGHDETWYGHKIAKTCGFPFHPFTIPKGYLWDCIDQLSEINNCYSEFTHPRQMAFVDKYANFGDVFSLGHWGDVLFDDMGVSAQIDNHQQVEIITKKIIKKGGLELAEHLWKVWGLSGDFKTYLKERILHLLNEINIPENANSQIRAFKSLYWAPRWTNVNLSVFESVRPITLPYFHNRMCEFICSVPEEYLAGRKIQIAYIKKRMPKLAKLTWQAQRPFNLYNFKYNKTPYNLPYRVYNKLGRTLSSKNYIQRNWELQFLGEENDKKLNRYLLNNTNVESQIPKQVIEYFYNKFKSQDAVLYSHPLSMLLTLSIFFKEAKG